MANILKWKEQLKVIYEKYNIYIDGLCRFMFTMMVFMTIQLNTGFHTVLGSPFVAIILALICALCPRGVQAPLTCALILAEFSAVAMEPALVLLIALLLMILTYFVFRMGNSWLMVLTIMFCLWNTPALILPIGLLMAPLDIVVVAFGIVIYGFMMVVRRDTSVFSTQIGSLGTSGKISYMINGLITNQRFLLVLISVCLCLLMIVFIRRRRVDYAPGIAACCGGVVFLGVTLLGNFFLNAGFDYVHLVIGTLLCGLACAFIILFIISVDYRRTEYVQFEDDEYYYFVKAVPKNTVSATNVEVVNISAETDEEPAQTEKISREETR